MKSNLKWYEYTNLNQEVESLSEELECLDNKSNIVVYQRKRLYSF